MFFFVLRVLLALLHRLCSESLFLFFFDSTDENTSNAKKAATIVLQSSILRSGKSELSTTAES